MIATLATLVLAAPVTAQQTFIAELVCDIATGALDSNPQHFTKAGSSVYFVADNGTGGREVFEIVGPGSCQAVDLGLGSAGYNPTALTAVNGNLYFLIEAAAEGRQIGGVVGGVPMYLPILLGVDTLELAAFQGSLYFGARDGMAGSELWRITAGVPSLAVDIQVGLGSSFPHKFRASNDRLYFNATTPATGLDLFAFTGTALISFDVVSGTGNFDVFDAIVGGVGQDLYAVSASSRVVVVPEGTFSAITLGTFTSVSELAVAANFLVFGADDGMTGTELHTTDGVTVTQHEVIAGAGNSAVEELSAVADAIWLSATNGVDGQEPKVFDPVTGMFVGSFDLNPGPADSFPYQITQLGEDIVAMGATVAGAGTEIVVATRGGAPGGTLLDFFPGPLDSFPDQFTAVGTGIAGAGAIFFRATTNTGQQLGFVTEIGGALAAGTVTLSGGPSIPRNLTEVEGDLYFSGTSTTAGREARRVVVPEPRAEALAFAALVTVGMLRVLRRGISLA